MSASVEGPTFTGETFVRFVPPSGPASPPFPKAVPFAGLALVERVVREVGPGLEDLARRVRHYAPAGAGAVALLTGCRRCVGCSTVAVALATVAAEERSVLLVDGDLVRRGLSARLENPPVTGWEDCFGQAGTFQEALQPITARPGLAFLPLREPVADPAGLLAGPALVEWQARLRQDYNLIVVDGGSVWEAGACWGPWADAALIVCDSGQKLADDWALGWDRLEETGTHVLGIVETMG